MKVMGIDSEDSLQYLTQASKCLKYHHNKETYMYVKRTAYRFVVKNMDERCVYLQFVTAAQGVLVDDADEDVDESEDEQFPPEELVHAGLPSKQQPTERARRGRGHFGRVADRHGSAGRERTRDTTRRRADVRKRMNASALRSRHRATLAV